MNNKLSYSEVSEIAIKDKFIIDEPTEVFNRLVTSSKRDDFTLDDIVSFINNEPHTIFFINNKLRIVEETSSDIAYVWIDTGLVDTLNKPIFISMLPLSSIYCGHYIGNIKVLSSLVIKYFPKNQRAIDKNIISFMNEYHTLIEERTNKLLPKSLEDTENNTSLKEVTDVNKIEFHKIVIPKAIADISRDVFEMLLINNWHSIEGLDRYIKIIGTRLNHIVASDMSDFFVMNKIKSVIVNTGLLDKFSNDIKIMYRLNISYGSYAPYKLMESKKEYAFEGFTKEQSCKNILPITFLTSEDVFTPTIDDFDINPRNLYHIIEERRDRFPESVKNTSNAILATRIKTELELGLKLNSIDNGYAKPYYSGSTGTVSWLLPLRINRDLKDEPELVLVTFKVGDFWEIKTILPYDDEIKDRLICTSLYGHLW